MKRFLFITLTVSLVMSVSAQEVVLEKLWQTEPILAVPESVLYDSTRSVLYVSNIDGKEPWAKDGQGSIAKLTLDGEVLEAIWVEGLHAPKGMGLIDDYLYVTDVDEIVTIDIGQGKIVDRYRVPNAERLNDLSVAEDGTIYFTDSAAGIVYELRNGELIKVVEGRDRLNGVLHSNEELLFVDDGSLYLVEDDGTTTEVAGGLEGSTDGIERVTADSWLVSCWQGTVYYVTRDGAVTLLLDGRPTETSAADLGYDPERRIAYFPGFWKNFVVAYRLDLPESESQ